MWKNCDVQPFLLLSAVLDLRLLFRKPFVWSIHTFGLLARPNSQHRLVLAQHRYDETTCVVSQSTILENRCAEAVRMGSQSSISTCRHVVTMCMGPNPQFWSSNGAQPEIRQDKRNHAHDFNFLENLKIWSHGGPRPIAHLLRTPARLNRYPRISDSGGNCSSIT